MASIGLPATWTLIIFLAINLKFLEAQQQPFDKLFYFSGRLVDVNTREPVTFSHIVNKTRGNAIISDTLGYFILRVSENDLLMATAIGYYDLPVYLKDSLILSSILPVFKMVPRIYPIQEVSINPIGTYEQFKYKMMNINIPETEAKLTSSITRDIELGIDTLDIIEPFMVVSPISAIYNLLSKEGKSQRKFQKILEEEKFRKDINYKYNNEMLKRITGMEGEELFDFISYCSFSREFLQRATELEIIEAIYEKLEAYRKIHQAF